MKITKNISKNRKFCNFFNKKKTIKNNNKQNKTKFPISKTFFFEILNFFNYQFFAKNASKNFHRAKVICSGLKKRSTEQN